jgi:thioredoxin-related protein
MTKFHFFFFLFLYPFLSIGQNIHFVDKNADIWKMSQSQNKIIFVDCQAVWCKPCKEMERNVFTNDTISRFYNEHFVNVSIDMDSAAGKIIDKKYNVRALPTFLFLDEKGNLLHQGYAYKNVSAFLELGREALDTNKQFATLKKRFWNGYRDTAFLKKLSYLASEASDNQLTLKVAAAYLNTQKDWLTPSLMEFILYFTKSVDFEGFAFILANQDTFKRKFGTTSVGRLEETIIPYDLSRRFLKVYQHSGAKDSLRTYLKGSLSERMTEKIMAKTALYQLQAARQDSLLLLAVLDYMKTFGTEDPHTLNNFAWTVYEQAEQPEILQLGVQWVLKAIRVNDYSHFNDTAANLFFKLKDKSKAKFYAERTLDIGKRNGENVSDIQALLLKINKL